MQTIRILVEISVYFLSKDNNDVFFFIFLLIRRVPTNSQPETFVCDGISFLLMSRHKKVSMKCYIDTTVQKHTTLCPDSTVS